jgi:hypothetical protein
MKSQYFKINKVIFIKNLGILANIGPISSSISGASSNCYSLEYFLNINGFSDDSKKIIEENIKKIGCNTLQSIIASEKKIELDTINSQTDFIGLDLVASKDSNHEIKFYLIEVNDHECISAFANYEIINGHKESNMLDEWIHIMIQRSFNYVFENKNVVIIDRYGFDELKLHEFFNKYKINFIIIDCQEHSAEYNDLFKFFRYYDYKNISFNEDMHANKVSEIIKNLNLEIDIVLTFNKNLEGLIELIKKLNITKINSAKNDKNRLFTIYRNIDYNYDVETVKITQTNDILKCNCFPLFTKYINKAKVFKKINSQEELLDLYNENKNSLDQCSMDLENFLYGNLFHVILIIYKESLVFIKIFCRDKGIQSCSTSILTETINHIKYNAHDYCLKNGFDTGIFLVKLNFSIQGIKILKKYNFENAIFAKRNFFDACVGIDFLKYFFLINFQIKPTNLNFETKIIFI